MNRSVIIFLFTVVISAFPIIVNGQNCDIPIRIISSPQVEDIPDRILDMVNSRLATAIASNRISPSSPYSQFFITAKFNHITEHAVPGPPKQFVIHSLLTLYIGDIENHNLLCSKAFELKGVGTSPQRALINSLQVVNVSNKNLGQFISEGRDKIVDYYNKNYNDIVAKANKAAHLNNYEEALSQICRIPECCIGFNEASDDIVHILKSYIDSNPEFLYNKAYTTWSSSPNSESAKIVSLYLSLIEKSSIVYSKSEQLAKEIKETLQYDYTCEMKNKLRDSVELKRAYIETARQIGAAYCCEQKDTETNILWIK